MYKNYLLVVLLVIIMIALTACAPDEVPDESVDAPDEAPDLTTDDDYPSRMVTVVVPFGAGGGFDTTWRAIASVAPQYLGQALIVQNQAGGAGAIAATEFMNTAVPDGYTLLQAGGSNHIMVPVTADVDYHPVDDFVWIIRMAIQGNVLTVRHDFPAENLEEFIQYLRDNPGELNFANAGTGSDGWMQQQLIKKEAGVDFMDVPFDGAGPAAVAVAGGHADAMLGSYPSVASHVEAGTLRVIASTTPITHPAVPDAQLFEDFGWDVSLPTMAGLAAPIGTPQHIIDEIHDLMKPILDDEAFIALAGKLGLHIAYLNGEDYKAAVLDGYEKALSVWEDRE